MIWPIKPLPKDLLPDKVLETAIIGKTRPFNRLNVICRKLLFIGYEIPDILMKAVKEQGPSYKNRNLPPIDFSIYDPNDPISILEILLVLFTRSQCLYSEPSNETLPLRDNTGGGELNIPKSLLIACLEKDTKETLSFFYPSRNIIMDIFSGTYGSYRQINTDLVTFLIEEGLKTDPKEVLFAMTSSNKLENSDLDKMYTACAALSLNFDTTQKLRAALKTNIGMVKEYLSL